jgi:hypothetical protein
VGEHVEQLSAEEEEHDEREEQRTLTQRELVRASLLRCPPQEPADSSRS